MEEGEAEVMERVIEGEVLIGISTVFGPSSAAAMCHNRHKGLL